eukprot:SAG22_NODE_348_length_11873_cov_4.151435_3_plen_135_part_00
MQVSNRSKLNFITWRMMVMAAGCYLPVGRVLRLATTTTIHTPSERVIQAYDAPFPSALHRAGAAAWPLMVPLTRSFGLFPVARDMDLARDHLQQWLKPALIMFSDKCFVSRGLDTYFMHLIPFCAANPVRCCAA